MKKLSSLFLFVLVALLILAVPAQAGVLNPTTGGTPGSWTKGANPSTIDPKKPVVLFVHGLNGSAGSWYDTSDMYQTALNNGYQTAFINLHDVTGTSQSMWTNGKLLADKIQEISTSFGGKKLVIVAHSKGGVDSQTALVHYNAYPYVSNVITLGSPHHGSQLADLAYSSEASWLADLLGSLSPGVYAMQTSYMSYFRSVTNNHANVNKNKFYTIAGNNYTSGSLSEFFGGLYLSSYGSNDGVVTVNNAYLPNGTMLKVGNWTHSQVKTSATFSTFKPYLVMATAAKEDSKLVEIAASKDKQAHHAAEPVASQSYMKGGQINGQAEEVFYVENDVDAIKLDWISSHPMDSLTFTGPNGKVEKAQVTTAQDDQMLKGAWHHTATIAKPKAGEWKVSANSGQAGAYLFTVGFETKGKSGIKAAEEQGGKKLKLQGEGLKSEKTKVSYRVDYVSEQEGKKEGKQSKKQLKKQENADIQELNIPTTEGSGVYSVTAEIEGETTEGFKYKRTLVKSVYVDEQGNTYTP
ncbi:triacylglycerol lipase [Paenibacillus sp. YYML68]|uniref:esterase/lipase family protein n=1 Tax=Paenibacillus sp. YYML68 TaxID=2909250 RepID=UPI002491600C|nr:alpha/beta fold hydrolase [Paenibacillus sp. YYML68]